MKQKAIKTLTLLVSLGLLALGAWALSQRAETSEPLPLQPLAQSGESTEEEGELFETFSLAFDFDGAPDQNSENVEFIPGESLLEAMVRVAGGIDLKIETKDYGSAGKFITKIGNNENGAGGKYWQFWINEKYSTVGASTYKVRSGDAIRWRFTSERE